ncbi:MAG: hypothetical protein V1494_01195 [Candidatus Diapherotrites archaeon]
MDLSQVTEGLKGVYYFFEDKYYAFLDKVNERLPVYKVVDPVDEAVPSFPLACLLVVVIILLLLFGLPWLLGGGETALRFKVLGSDSNPLAGVDVTLGFDQKTVEKTTNSLGEFTVNARDLNIFVDISEDGFKHYKEYFQAQAKGVNNITLDPETAALQAKTLLEIYDSESNCSGLLKGTVNVSFSCSGKGKAPSSITTANGKIEVLPPEDCGVLKAFVSSSGYDGSDRSLLSERQSVCLTKKKVEKGKIIVTVKDSEAMGALPDIRVSIYSSENITKAADSTDESGSAEFDLAPGTYYARASDESAAYGPDSSGTIMLAANQAERAEILLSKNIVPGKKIRLFFSDELGQAIVDAHAILFEGDAPVSEGSSDLKGMLEFRNLDENKSYSISASHPDFVLKAVPNVPLIGAGDSTAFNVILAKASVPPDSNNSSGANVSVKSFEGKFLEGAKVSLYDTRYSFFVAQGITGSNGMKSFANLPSGTYYAKAELEEFGEAGESEHKSLVLGASVGLEVVLVLKEAKLNVRVLEKANNRPVAGAKVEFFDFGSDENISQKGTPASGFVSESIKWNKKPYIVVSKEGFYPVTTLPFTLSPDANLLATVYLEPESAFDRPAIVLDSILKQDRKPATSLNKNSTYFFEFKLVVPDDSYSNVQSVVRSGLESQLNASQSKMVLRKIVSPKGGAFHSYGFNSLDPYVDENLTDGDAKQARLDLGGLGKGIYYFEAEAFIKSTAQKDEVIELRYGLKGLTNGGAEIRRPSPEESSEKLYKTVFVLGQPIDCSGAGCPEFVFTAILTDKSGTQFPLPIALEQGKEVELWQDIPYELDFTVFNRAKGKENFSGIVLELLNDNTAIEATPSSVSIASLEFGASFNAKAELSALKQSTLSRLSLALSVNAEDNNAVYDFNVKAKNDLNLFVYPSSLVPGISNILNIQLKDASTGQRISGASISVDIGDDSFTSPEFIGTTDSSGFIGFQLPALSADTTVYVKASKAGYNGKAKSIPVESSFIIPPAGRFNCVSINPGEVNTLRGLKENFTVRAQGCAQSVSFQLQSELTLDSVGFTLAPTDAKNVLVSADKFLGEYPVYVKAKFPSDTEFYDVNELTVYITDPNSCFSINKTSFDLLHSSDSAVISNKCYAYVQNPFIPDIEFDTHHAAADYAKPQIPLTYEFKWKANARVAAGGTYVSDWVELLNLENFSQQNLFEVLDSKGTFRLNPDGSFTLSGFGAPDSSTDEWKNTHTISAQPFAFSPSFSGNVANYGNEEWLGLNGIVEARLTAQQANRQPTVSVSHSGSDYLEFSLDDAAEGYAFFKPLVEAKFTRAVVNEEFGSTPKMVRLVQPQDITYDLGEINFSFTTIADATVQQVSVSVENNSNGLVVSWIDPSSLTITKKSTNNFEVKGRVFGRFKGKDVDLGSEIAFDAVNTGLPSTQYALLSVEDHSDRKPTGNVNDITFEWSLSGCSAPPNSNATIIATKILCSHESDLPNWGAGGPDITKNTAIDFLKTHPGCRVESGWSFQWGYDGVSKPKDTVGIAGSGWHTFGPTDESGQAKAEISQLNDTPRIWVREAFKDTRTYVGFSGGTSSRNESAEVYCHNDVYTYDNWDYIASPKAGGTYYCIAFNALKRGSITPAPVPDYNEAPIGLSTVSGIATLCTEDDRTPSKKILDFATISPGCEANYSTDENRVLILKQGADLYACVDYDMDGKCDSSCPPKYGTESEKFHVKLEAGTENTCYGVNDEIGFTGENALPRLKLSWLWQNIPIGTCDYSNPGFVYCDSTQFTIEVLKKLQMVEALYADGNIGQIDPLLHFQAYLMKDGFSPDFQADFTYSAVNRDFFGPNQWFVSGSRAFSRVFSDSTRFVFTSMQAPENNPRYNVSPLPAPGLYSVNIELSFDDGQIGRFFKSDDSPNVKVKVKIDSLQESKDANPLYFMPFDSMIGEQNGVLLREGYGSSYSGDALPIRSFSSGNLEEIETKPGGTGLASVQAKYINDFTTTNKTNRGSLALITMNSANGPVSFKFSPSDATPVAMKLKANASGEAGAFYHLKEYGKTIPIELGSYTSLWDGAASTVRNIESDACLDFTGNYLFYERNDYPLGNFSFGCQGLNEADSALRGFAWGNAEPNDYIYLKSIFFTPKNQKIQLYASCNNETIISPQGNLVNQNTVPFDLRFTAPIEENGRLGISIDSLENIFSLVSNGKACAGISENRVNFWWNTEFLYSELEKYYPSEITPATKCVESQLVK